MKSLKTIATGAAILSGLFFMSCRPTPVYVPVYVPIEKKVPTPKRTVYRQISKPKPTETSESFRAVEKPTSY
jgi:hypothetical protein